MLLAIELDFSHDPNGKRRHKLKCWILKHFISTPHYEDLPRKSLGDDLAIGAVALLRNITSKHHAALASEGCPCTWECSC
jgi:hypothetical protein